MPHIYIINLKHRYDRLQKTLEQLRLVGIPERKIHIVEAVDTRSLTYEQALQKFPQIDPLNLHALRTGERREHHELTSGSIGCFYSHIHAWRDIMQSNHGEPSIVVEDDIYFPNPFRAREILDSSNLLQKRLQGTHLYLLGHTGFHKDHPVFVGKTKHEYPQDLNIQFFMGLQCYAMLKDTATLLLSCIGAPRKQLDWQICDLAEKKIIRIRAAVVRYAKVFDEDSDIQLSQPCHKSWR